MPRATRLPPTVIRAESLDNGREIKDSFVDDFTGEVIQPTGDQPGTAPVMAQELRNRDNLAKLATQRALLKQVGILPSRAACTAKQFKRRM